MTALDYDTFRIIIDTDRRTVEALYRPHYGATRRSFFRTCKSEADCYTVSSMAAATFASLGYIGRVSFAA